MDFKKEFVKAKDFLKENSFIIADKNLKGILLAKKLRYPLLLVGPTGCGKTLLLTLLSKFWGGEYEYESLNGSKTIHDLTQERILGSDGSFKERDMVLAKWLRTAQKKFCMLQLDEVNAARPETLMAMHPIMDLKSELHLPYSNENLKVTENALLVMSANEGDEYQGINAMNAAFQERYVKIHLPYIQGKELAQLLTNKTNVPLEETNVVVKTWEKYMSSRDPEQPIIGIRTLERWCEMSKELGLREAGVVAFASKIAKTEDEIAMVVEADFFVNIPK